MVRCSKKGKERLKIASSQENGNNCCQGLVTEMNPNLEAGQGSGKWCFFRGLLGETCLQQSWVLSAAFWALLEVK